jgi:hypothetical protein
MAVMTSSISLMRVPKVVQIVLLLRLGSCARVFAALRSGQTALPPGEPQQSGGMLLSPTMTLYDSMSATQV